MDDCASEAYLSSMTSKAEIFVEVMSDGSVNYEFAGNTYLLPQLIGAVEMAKAGLVTRANNDHGNMRWGDEEGETKQQLQKEKHNTYNSGEVEVTRDIALALYYQTFTKLRDRIAAIGKSSKTATFHVDPSLLKL